MRQCKKLTKKQRNVFLSSIDNVLKKCKVGAELEIDYDVEPWSERTSFNAPINILEKCTKPKNLTFSITIRGYCQER